jgi:hypothetical protein
LLLTNELSLLISAEWFRPLGRYLFYTRHCEELHLMSLLIPYTCHAIPWQSTIVYTTVLILKVVMLSVAKHLLEADKSQRTWCTHSEEILRYAQDDKPNHSSSLRGGWQSTAVKVTRVTKRIGKTKKNTWATTDSIFPCISYVSLVSSVFRFY